MKFKFYTKNLSLNGVSVAVYAKNKSTYVLKVVKNGRKVKDTFLHEISIEDYENLPDDPYNSLVRLCAAMELCGHDMRGNHHDF